MDTNIRGARGENRAHEFLHLLLRSRPLGCSCGVARRCFLCPLVHPEVLVAPEQSRIPTLSERILEGLLEGLRSSSQGPSETVFSYVGWRMRRSKADELRIPPRGEEFESTAEERSFTTGRRGGVTGPGAGATRGERHRDRR